MKRIYKLLVGLSVLGMCLNGCTTNNSEGDTEPGENPSGGEHTHEWGTPTYTWATDYSTCTAERVCLTNSTHKEMETANSSYEVVTDAQCETDGLGRYSVSFTNAVFSPQTHDSVINAHGHNWSAPTYTWATDYSTCTAKRVCLSDSTHIETETVSTVFEPMKDSNTNTIYNVFKALFVNSFFESQEHKTNYHGETPFVDKEEGVVFYGLYPQTNVNDASLISILNEITTPESNGWYFYEDNYYAKVNANPYESNYKFDNGATIVSGTTYWFKCEPIIWNILTNNDVQYYIVSSVILDAYCFYNNENKRTINDQTIYPNNYEYSDIRTWLNDDFYNSTFALGNKNIQTTTVDNSASTTQSDSNPYTCNSTQDNVFLPSFQDYINGSYGFSTSTKATDTRCCRTTDFARARGIYYYTNNGSWEYNGFYWTRSPFEATSNDFDNYYEIYERVEVVHYGGKLTNSIVDLSDYGVRPSLSISIE